jgi:hypothetical protein
MIENSRNAWDSRWKGWRINMELKDYIRIEFEGLERGLKRVLNGLSQKEVTWQPAFGCNSIGLILFHMTRSEDSFIQARLQDKPQVWETGKWFKKLNLAENEVGGHFTPQQVNAFPVPGLEDILSYHAAVRAQTLAYLDTMTAAAFDKKITMPHFGERSTGDVFSIVIGHSSQHIGEISYLRGLQRGMET